MTLFQALSRRRPRPTSVVPLGFTAVAEALRRGDDPTPPCQTVGRRLAEVGVGLDEVLDGLELTYRGVGAGEPAFTAVRAVSVGWADSSLEYLHGLSCEDPLTGLASTAHLRTRLAEVYRAADGDDVPVPRSHALVVVELGEPRAVGPGRDRSDRASFDRASIDRALRFVDVVDAVRSAYPCGETVARLGGRRAATLVRRDDAIGHQVELLRRLLTDWGVGPEDHRVWIERLPTTNEGVARLLDDLAR